MFLTIIQIYIFGGVVASPNDDIIEVFDSTQATIGPLLDASGIAVTISALVSIEHSCSIPVEGDNTIYVTGGSKGSRYF